MGYGVRGKGTMGLIGELVRLLATDRRFNNCSLTWAIDGNIID